MPRGRPPRTAAPPPPPTPDDEQDPAADDAGEDPDAEQGDEETNPEEAPKPGARPPSPLDEQAGSPGGGGGAVRFTPGFGIPPRSPGEGHNHIPPLPFMPGMGGGGARAAEPRRVEREPYAQDAEPIESEVQEQSDGALTKAFLGQYPGDMRVDVEVWQVDGLQAVPRGKVENMMLSDARVPTRYIKYGGLGGSGQWQLEFYSAMTGKFLRRVKVTLPGDEPPANFRVEDAVAEEQALKALLRALSGGNGAGPGGIPLPAYADEKAWLRQQIEDQKKTLEQMRMDFERRDREAERQRFEDRIRQLESGGGGQNQVLATITALAPFMQQSRGDDRLVDVVLQMNGPGMMHAQAAMYNEILTAATKFSGHGSDDGLKGMIGGALKGAVEKYLDNMAKRQQAHDEFMRKRELAKEQREAAKANGGQPPASPATPAQPHAEGGNGASDDKRLFARMIKDVRQAMEKVGNPAVPAAEKPSARDVATKFVLCFRQSIELGLHKNDPQIDSMTSEILTNPELFIAKWCAAYGPTAEFGADVARIFRQMSDLPPLEQPKPAAEPTAAPAATAAPSAEPEPPPSVPVSSTIRLPSSPPSRQPEAPVAAVAPSTSAPAAAVEPLPKVQGQDAEVGQVAEPQGPVHVVGPGAEAPPAQGVEVRDAQGEGGEPPQKDGGGLVDAAHPAGEVEKPGVPNPPSVVVEPHNP